MATFYEWCIEEWTGHPDAEDSDSIDPAFTDRLDDAIRRVPEALCLGIPFRAPRLTPYPSLRGNAIGRIHWPIVGLFRFH